jgi:hypothetical protein
METTQNIEEMKINDLKAKLFDLQNKVNDINNRARAAIENIVEEAKPYQERLLKLTREEQEKNENGK